MNSDPMTLFVLGGSGFIGRHLLQQTVAAGVLVKALARSEQSAAAIASTGASVIRGFAEEPSAWIGEAAEADVIIDLLQPARTKRVGRSTIRRIADQRQVFTRSLVTALGGLAQSRRPHLIAVSGIDDLAPDPQGFLSADSPLSVREYGFNTIGIPGRRIIEQSGLDATYAYLGTVYGPGGAFGNEIFPALAEGRWKNFGAPSDRMLLVHVEDAARGLARIAETASRLPPARSMVLTDDEPATMNDFFGMAADLMGVRRPGSVPAFIAALVAGRPIVETTLQPRPARSSFSALGLRLVYPSYREGLPATLSALGYLRATASRT